jgi:hypothetical protein
MRPGFLKAGGKNPIQTASAIEQALVVAPARAPPINARIAVAQSPERSIYSVKVLVLTIF